MVVASSNSKVRRVAALVLFSLLTVALAMGGAVVTYLAFGRLQWGSGLTDTGFELRSLSDSNFLESIAWLLVFGGTWLASWWSLFIRRQMRANMDDRFKPALIAVLPAVALYGALAVWVLTGPAPDF